MKLRELQEALQDVTVFETPEVQWEQYPTPSEIAAHMLYTAQMSYGDIQGKHIADLGSGCGVLSAGALLLGAHKVTAFDIDREAIRQAKVNISRLSQKYGDDSAGEEEEESGELVEELNSPASEEAWRSWPIEFVVCDILASEEQAIDSPKSLPKNKAAAAKGGAGGQIREVKSSGTSCSSLKSYPASFDTIIMNPPFGTRRKGADLAFVDAACSLSKGAIYSLHKTSTRSHIQSRFAKGKRKDLWTGEVIAQLRYNVDSSYTFHKNASVDVEVDFWRFKKGT